MPGLAEATAALTAVLAHWTHDGWGTWWGVAMMIGMAVFWAAVIVAGLLLVRHLIRERDRSSERQRGAALEVLERRFAAGEIGAEELRERRAVLEEGRSR